MIRMLSRPLALRSLYVAKRHLSNAAVISSKQTSRLLSWARLRVVRGSPPQVHAAIQPIFGRPHPRCSSSVAYQSIQVKRSELKEGRGAYAEIDIANPRKLNIVSSETLRELKAAIESVQSDTSLRVVVIAGQHIDPYTPSFCGGANIHEMRSIQTPEGARAFITRIYEVCEALRAVPAATIAAIDGLCLGAGLEIAAACDFRLATKRSLFAMPEVEIGIPSVVHARSLVNIMGWQEAKKLMMFATKLDGQAANRVGLVDSLADGPDELVQMIQRDIGILSGHGRKAMHAQKRLFKTWEEVSFHDGMLASIDAFADAYHDGGTEPRGLMNEWIEKQRQRKQ